MKKILLIIGLVTLFTVGCVSQSEKKDTTTDIPKEVTGTLSDKTKIVPKTEQIVSYESTKNEVVFDEKSSYAENLKQGDIISTGITDTTPYGLLKKVKTVKKENGKYIINVENAELNEAVKKGTAKFEKLLTASELKDFYTSYTGITITKVNNKGPKRGTTESDIEWNVGFDNATVYDEGGNKLILNGSMGVKPGMVFDVDIDNFKIQSLEFGLSTKFSGTLSVDGNLSETVKHEIPVLIMDFLPVTIPFVVPIVIVPRFDIVIGIDGKAKGSFKFAASQVTQGKATSKFTIGSVTSGYTDSKWNTNSTLKSEFKLNEPTVANNVEVSLYAGAKLSLLLYYGPGGYVSAYPYTRFAADINKVPWWGIYGGIDIGFGFTCLGFNYGDTIAPDEFTIVTAAKYSDDGVGKYNPSGAVEGWHKKWDLPLDELEKILGARKELNKIFPTSDGGIVGVGSKNTNYGLLYKASKNGDVEKAYHIAPLDDDGDSKTLLIEDVVENNKGELIFTGYYGLGLFIAKFYDGKLMFIKNINENINISYFAERTEIIPLGSSKYAVVLANHMVIFDENGNVLNFSRFWENSKENPNGWEDSVILKNIALDKDGNLYVGGKSIPGGFLAKFDSGYNYIKRRVLRYEVEINKKWVEFPLGIECMTYDSEGNAYIGTVGVNGFCISKVDFELNRKWSYELECEKSKDDMNVVYYPKGIILTSDDSFAMVIQTIAAGGLNPYNNHVIKYDRKGNFLWHKKITYSKDGTTRELEDIQERKDGKGLFVSGHYKSNSAVNPELFFLNQAGELKTTDTTLEMKNFSSHSKGLAAKAINESEYILKVESKKIEATDIKNVKVIEIK